ncbi:dihydrofolate reductase family protein [Cohnella nanjingensis]|uniref:Dihydrofolate reductase family protein n=1 Tax=Cohnella nanjingensis TaxID=1387779 RepID=A0A7X0RWC7_9BACL|nr:dihydrofolate reductase family protein [Cohnella nanjingensis]MBB6673666.1 dihydrofolate reductase family protein [Cohnella nanjingensis]
MRKLLLQMQMSIDGYVVDMDGSMDWMVWSYGNDWAWDTKLRQYHTNLMASIDCVLLSRKMAVQGFNDHWATLAQRSDNPQSHFAKSLTNAHKVVFTKTLTRSIWNNNTLAKGELVDEILALKQVPGKNIIAFGGAGFASSLIKSGLVDEFHLIVNPVVLGEGLSPFKEINSSLNLNLVEAIPYSRGIVVLKYSK